MRLVPIPTAWVVRKNPHLWPGIPGCPNTEQEVGRCINVKPVMNGSPKECGNPVWAGRGYADADGRPFRAYYCKECGDAILRNLTIA